MRFFLGSIVCGVGVVIGWCAHVLDERRRARSIEREWETFELDPLRRIVEDVRAGEG